MSEHTPGNPPEPDAKTQELRELESQAEKEVKTRSRIEYALVIVCVLAFVYTYPVETLADNPQIEIPAVSIKIPLRDAIIFFPTLIATLYLMFISSATQHFMLVRNASEIRAERPVLGELEQISASEVARQEFYRAVSKLLYILNPSALLKGFGSALMFAELVVAVVYSTLPYVVSVFISARTWTLLHSKMILAWDLLCLLVMVAAFIGAFRVVRRF
jgi:hypothetical protein